MTGRSHLLKHKSLAACLYFFNLVNIMENNNKTVDTLSMFIKNTVTSYVKALNDNSVSPDSILQALMKAYNSFLIEIFVEALKKDIPGKSGNGESTKTDNKQ